MGAANAERGVARARLRAGGHIGPRSARLHRLTTPTWRRIATIMRQLQVDRIHSVQRPRSPATADPMTRAVRRSSPGDCGRNSSRWPAPVGRSAETSRR